MSKVMIFLVFAFKVMIFYQIRPQTVFKVTISLVFAFKVKISIRLGSKLCLK